MLSRLVGPNAALRLHWPKDGFHWRFFRDILKVGLIACLVVILTNGTVLMVTGLIGRAGDAAIAGYGIGSRLEYMMVPISFGIGAALTAMVGTSIGARPVCPRAAGRLDRRLHGGRHRGGDRHHRGDRARPVARPVHPPSRRARLGPHLPAHRRAGLRLLRPRHGALLREPGHRRDDLAGGGQPQPHRDRGMRQPAGARRAGLGPARACSPSSLWASSRSPPC